MMNGLFSLKVINMENRIKELDFIRGFAMLLVILHHSGCIGGKYILAFHMPLFFLMSGYMFSIKDRTHQKVSSFIFKNFKRLIVTYFIFEVFILCISLIFAQFFHFEINLLKAFQSIFFVLNNSFYNGFSLRLWFLPCMFFCNVFVFVILKYIKLNNKFFYLIFASIFFVFSFILNYFSNMRLPFTLDISLMGTAFMFLGYSLSNYMNKLIFKKTNFLQIIIFIILQIIFIFLTFINNPFYMYIDEYGNYLYALIGAISGSICSFIIIKIIYKIFNKLSKSHFLDYVLWIGNNTILLFPVHLILIFIIRYFGFHWILIFIFTCMLVIPTINMLNKTWISKFL